MKVQLALAASLCFGSMASAATFSTVPVPAALTGGGGIVGVSADGLAVYGRASGQYSNVSFRWTQQTGSVSIPDGYTGPAQDPYRFALAVSGDGATLAGQRGPTSYVEAYRWNSSGGATGLGFLPGSSFGYSTANAISYDGSVIVGSGTNGSGSGEAFRWTEATGMVGLGDLPGGYFESAANGVSADGSAIVGVGRAATGDRAFRWTLADGMVDLGDLPGGPNDSVALAVSADGSIVIGRSGTASGYFQAFRWTAADGMQDLSDATVLHSSATDISADGAVVVGNFSAVATGYADRPFVWTADTGMNSLVALLAAQGATGFEGWLAMGNVRVSADGRTLVGDGLDAQGEIRIWVATLDAVPLPGTLWLAGPAVALLAPWMRARRR